MNKKRTSTGKDFLQKYSVKKITEIRDKEEDEKYKRHYEAALHRKNGESMRVIAERFDVSSGTIANWLRNMTERGLGKTYKVPHGRPPKFTKQQLKDLEKDMRKDPETYGLDAERWVSVVVAQYAKQKFDISITPGSMRRLMLREKVKWPASAEALRRKREAHSS